MKHTIIYLDYLANTESHLLDQLKKCGVSMADIQIIIVRERGIANAINTGLRQVNNEVGLITILGNDIFEPQDWLKKRQEFCKHSIGICSIPFESKTEIKSENIIGNYTMQRDVLIKVGAMNERFDPYGAIDLDYCVRTRAAGYVTTYIPNTIAKTGDHGIFDTRGIYDFNKKEMIERTWQQHAEQVDDIMTGKLPHFISL